LIHGFGFFVYTSVDVPIETVDDGSEEVSNGSALNGKSCWKPAALI